MQGGVIEVGAPTGKWQLIVVYRGKHCPVSRNYLASLQQIIYELDDLGVEVLALTADGREKAEAFVSLTYLCAALLLLHCISVHVMCILSMQLCPLCLTTLLQGASDTLRYIAAQTHNQLQHQKFFSNHAYLKQEGSICITICVSMPASSSCTKLLLGLSHWNALLSACLHPAVCCYPLSVWSAVSNNLSGVMQLDSLRATTETKEITYRIAYGLRLTDMHRWGLYVSNPRNIRETEHPFPEPAMFLINPEGQVQVAEYSNSPFCRPDLRIMIEGEHCCCSKVMLLFCLWQMISDSCSIGCVAKAIQRICCQAALI